jgi:hypothetical protein
MRFGEWLRVRRARHHDDRAAHHARRSGRRGHRTRPAAVGTRRELTRRRCSRHRAITEFAIFGRGRLLNPASFSQTFRNRSLVLFAHNLHLPKLIAHIPPVHFCASNEEFAFSANLDAFLMRPPRRLIPS